MRHGGEICHEKEIKYDFSVNINPLGLPEAAVRALRESLPLLTRYPDQECRTLRLALEDYTGVSADRIVCGNGASELLEASVRALRPEKILLTAPSFSGYRHAAEGAGVKIVWHHLRREEDFALTARYLEDLEKLDPFEKADTPEDPDGSTRESTQHLERCPGMAILCSPSNPVGSLADPGLLLQILNICERRGIWLLVDECFLGFVDSEERRTMRRYLQTKPYSRHLLVLDAFTKRFAMPGLRLGYLMAADPDVLKRIRDQQPEWSVSVPAQTAGCAALREDKEGAYMARAREMLRTERTKMETALRSMGMHVYPGGANFIFFSSETELFEPLLSRGILLRSCENYPGLQKGDYRIAVLQPGQNAVLLQAIGEIVNEKKQADTRTADTVLLRKIRDNVNEKKQADRRTADTQSCCGQSARS